jgi:hypothetical protein
VLSVLRLLMCFSTRRSVSLAQRVYILLRTSVLVSMWRVMPRLHHVRTLREVAEAGPRLMDCCWLRRHVDAHG